ncbi:MAG TPA: orotate phosphoribosyltransferase [Pseudomonadales bacterium]|nr:orotate phosphoribosyltransferase [Pseudomonadales bacterium]HNN87407.1 orotate phosphoribosyltransferase [Pseudomonadales bacterium]
MQDYQQQFIQLALTHNALRFGEFTLKSGRTSPYFFNAGQFHSGGALAALGHCYAAALIASGIEFDMLFGPAYKGIPLVSSIAIALARDFGRDVPWCFNRKEAKDHGEGGSLVGAPLQGKVVIVDDVITAGTAIGEVMQLFSDYPQARASAILIGLDRQERGQDGDLSAAQTVSLRYGIPVHSVLGLDELISFLQQANDQPAVLAAIQRYRAQYGTR